MKIINNVLKYIKMLFTTPLDKKIIKKVYNNISDLEYITEIRYEISFKYKSMHFTITEYSCVIDFKDKKKTIENRYVLKTYNKIIKHLKENSLKESERKEKEKKIKKKEEFIEYINGENLSHKIYNMIYSSFRRRLRNNSKYSDGVYSYVKYDGGVYISDGVLNIIHEHYKINNNYDIENVQFNKKNGYIKINAYKEYEGFLNKKSMEYKTLLKIYNKTKKQYKINKNDFDNKLLSIING